MSFAFILLHFAAQLYHVDERLIGAQSPLLSLPVLRNSRGESHFFTTFVSNQLTLY